MRRSQQRFGGPPSPHPTFGHPMASQGRSGGGGRGGALASGDDADGGVDCGAPGDGDARTFEPPAASAREVRRQVAIIKTTPFLLPMRERRLYNSSGVAQASMLRARTLTDGMGAL